MLRVLELLLQLQSLDTRIDTERERIATIEATVRDRSEYENAKRRFDEQKGPVQALDTDQKDLELHLGTARSQLTDAETKLYSGKVGSPRELDDLQRRGADLRRQIGVGEERLLRVMQELDDAKTALTEAETNLRRIVGERRTLETDLMAERKSLAGDLRAAQTERENVRAEIDAATLRSYDRLRTRHQGQALAEVRQRTCQGCRVSLIAALEQRLRHGETLVTCQSCGRILYLVN